MIFLMIFNIMLICFCFFMSKRKVYGRFSYNALNPIVFLAFLNVFFLFDFYFLYDLPIIEIYERGFLVTQENVFSSFLLFTAFNFCYFSMVVYFSYGYNYVRSTSNFFNFSKQTTAICFWTIAATITGILILNIGLFIDMFAGKTTRQIFFSNNKFIHILFSMIIPAFAMYVANHQDEKNKIKLVFLVTLIFVLFTGSRGNILLLTLILLFIYTVNKRKINPLLLFAAIPLIGTLLLVTRYYFREAWRFASIQDFIDANNGIGHVFFSTAEISMADVLVTIDIWKDELNRFPFESFLAGLMYPLPRAIFTFKPFGSGGTLTEFLSPSRWEFTRSEIVTTGYGDLLMQFGVLGALFVFLLLTYFWIKSVINIIHMPRATVVCVLPFLLWWAYMFFRADIFNVAGSIWTFLLVVFMCKFIQKLLIVRTR